YTVLPSSVSSRGARGLRVTLGAKPTGFSVMISPLVPIVLLPCSGCGPPARSHDHAGASARRCQGHGLDRTAGAADEDRTRRGVRPHGGATPGPGPPHPLPRSG